MQTYVLVNNQQTGPFSDEEINIALSKSEISYEHLAWRDGMTEWQPLRTLFSPPKTLPPPPPSLPPPVASESGKNVNAGGKQNLVVTIVVAIVIAWWLIPKGCSNTDTRQVASSPPQLPSAPATPVKEYQTITLGARNGTYESIPIRKIESRMLDIAANQTKVQTEYNVGDLIIEPNQQRLNLRPLMAGDTAVRNIDVLVSAGSPLYDKIVDVNPQFNTPVTVYGTVTQYNNTLKSVYIIPDEIVFKIEKK